MVLSHVRERVLSAFSDLEFEEERHIYTLNSIIIPSVSKKVENHCEKFDAYKKIKTYSGEKTLLELSANKQTRERGYHVSKDQLHEEWRKKNKDACDLGHDTHGFMEDYDGSQTPITNHQKAGVKFFKDMTNEYEVLFREIRMFSRQYMYAGTEDLILIHRETGHLIAADYKTNGDLFKNYKGKTLLPPFDLMEDCPFNKYKLQLSYYQIPLEEVGLCVKDRWLVYLKPDATYKVFSLESYVDELKQCLNNRKN